MGRGGRRSGVCKQVGYGTRSICVVAATTGKRPRPRVAGLIGVAGVNGDAWWYWCEVLEGACWGVGFWLCWGLPGAYA